MHTLSRFLLYSVTIICFSTSAMAQFSAQDNIAFGNYLIRNELYNDAIVFLNSKEYKHNTQDPNYLFIKGWAFYNLKQLDSSATFLAKVPSTAEFYHKARFFSALSYAHIGNYSNANETINQTDSLTEELQELANLELAGVALLARDLDSFKQLEASFTHQNYNLAEHQETLSQLSKDIANFKPKSPLLAGTLSAIVPGLGKIYAGKVGEGISALLTSTIIGAIAIENYNRSGIKSAGTIATGTLFAAVYAANIYGSVYSVKAYRDDFDKTINYRVLFHIHIPLRNVFN